MDHGEDQDGIFFVAAILIMRPTGFVRPEVHSLFKFNDRITGGKEGKKLNDRLSFIWHLEAQQTLQLFLQPCIHTISVAFAVWLKINK